MTDIATIAACVDMAIKATDAVSSSSKLFSFRNHCENSFTTKENIESVLTDWLTESSIPICVQDIVKTRALK